MSVRDIEILIRPLLEPGIEIDPVRIEMGLLRTVKMVRVLDIFDAGI